MTLDEIKGLNNHLFYLQRKWNKIIEKPTEE